MKDDVWVTWFECDCAWGTKYCDENHKKGAMMPLEVVEAWAMDPEE